MKSAIFAVMSISIAFGAEFALAGQEREPKQSEITLDALEQLCEGFDDPLVVPSDECHSKLDQYFLARSVWEESEMYLYTGQYGDIVRSLVNPRARYLSFDSVDHYDGDYPLWSDIFDDDLKSRYEVVASVFDDDVCRDVSVVGAIDPSLAQRCHAQDLIKYAIYIDACISGFHRDDLISEPGGVSRETAYVRSLRAFHRGHMLKQLGGDIESITRSALHTAWIVKKCQPPFFYPVDSNLKAYKWGSEGGLNTLEFAESMKLAYSAAAGISARSGDIWAIKSYYPRSPLLDPEYWRSMFEIEPVLVHRLLASPVGYGVLTEEEQAWHAVAAHELLKTEGVPINSDIKGYLDSLSIDASEDILEKVQAYLERDDAKRTLEDRVKLPW